VTLDEYLIYQQLGFMPRDVMNMTPAENRLTEFLDPGLVKETGSYGSIWEQRRRNARTRRALGTGKPWDVDVPNQPVMRPPQRSGIDDWATWAPMGQTPVDPMSNEKRKGFQYDKKLWDALFGGGQ